MNKASFLSLVRQASHISDQDVEELEKLVVNFPYCQTAHLLIAKAAYDKGSMLSNQKLKKAAIYAANRQLLKKLIHTSDATVALQPVEQAEEAAPTLPEEVRNRVAETVAKAAEKVEFTTAATTADITLETVGTEPIIAAEIPHEVTDNDETAIAEAIAETEIHVIPEAEVSPAESLDIPAEKLSAKTIETEPAVTVNEILEENDPEIYDDEVIAEEILAASEQLPNITELPEITEQVEIQEQVSPEEITPEPEFVPEKEEAMISEEITQPEPELISEKKEEQVIETTSEIAEGTVAETPEKAGEIIAETAEQLDDIIDIHELLLEDAPEVLEEEAPEVQPEISTKPEAQPKPEEIPVAAAHDDILHETLASFDQDLFRPEKETEETETGSDLKVVYAEDEIQTIFNRDSIGYWMSSSRMGESLELKNELTSKAPTEFHPELILEYSKTHELHKEIKPVSSNLSKQLEIIDEFLKMTPRLKAMANSKIKAEPQEDLSFKSSKISKNLATESYANILVQQGKIKKAIKIYEHLILKFPEKKPYFVAQIEKLQNQE